MSSEEAGREARYALFTQVASDVGATKVVLGHHMDDQAETVLMRLMQGEALDCGDGILREGIFTQADAQHRAEVKPMQM